MFDHLFECLRQQVNDRGLDAARFYHVSPGAWDGLPKMQMQTDVKKKFKASDDLDLSSFESESNVYKAWILNDGTVIPVDYTHGDIPFEVYIGDDTDGEEITDSEQVQESYWEFLATGAFRMSIISNRGTFVGNSTERPTKKQIEAIKRLFKKYGCDNVLLEIGDNYVESQIDSLDRLEAVIQYGKEVAMDERRVCESLPPIQQAVKDEYGSSTSLVSSTWSGEEDWLKFMVLLDGTVVPVDFNHEYTISTSASGNLVSGYDRKSDAVHDFMESGGIQGKIDHHSNEMNLWYRINPTPAQVKSVLRLWNKYHCLYLMLDTLDDEDCSWCGEELSAQQVAAVLKYGLKMLKHAVEEGGQVSGRHTVNESVDKIQLPEGQQIIKDEIRSSLDFPTTKWGIEDFGKKFIILNDGTPIPVDTTHEDSVAVGWYKSAEEFGDSGGVEGAIVQNTLEIYRPPLSRLTGPQVKTITRIWKRYWPDSFHYPTYESVVSIKSVDQLLLVIKNGPEYAEHPVDEAIDSSRKSGEGFIRPDGSVYFVDDGHYFHAIGFLGWSIEYAAKRKLDPIVYFGRKTGEIRVWVERSWDRVAVELFSKIVTPNQVKTILKMAKKSGEFLWDFNPGSSGVGIHSFVDCIISKGIQVDDIMERNGRNQIDKF